MKLEFDKISKEMKTLKLEFSEIKNTSYITQFSTCFDESSEQDNVHIKGASKKGVSSWLTCLPLEEHGSIVNKKEFSDAICLRCNIPLKGLPKYVYSFGKKNYIDHPMTCAKGNYKR